MASDDDVTCPKCGGTGQRARRWCGMCCGTGKVSGERGWAYLRKKNGKGGGDDDGG